MKFWNWLPFSKLPKKTKMVWNSTCTVDKNGSVVSTRRCLYFGVGPQEMVATSAIFLLFSTRFPSRWVHLLIFSNFVRFFKQLCEISASWFGISETTVWKFEWFQSKLCQKEDLASHWQLESLRRFGTFYRSHSKLGQFLDFQQNLLSNLLMISY